MDRRETLSKGEELLRQALDECLEEDLSFVPPERELSRTHRFSEAFEKRMEELLDAAGEQNREREVKRHFRPRYAQWAACILVFCVCGGLVYYVAGPDRTDSGISADQTVQESAAVEESAEAEEEAVTTEEAAGEALTADAAEDAADMESAADTENASSQQMSEATKLLEQTAYCGDLVELAEQQEVPEYLDYVTTLVNCPVLDSEDPVLIQTIGNTGEEELRYLSRYEMDVWINGGWYRIDNLTAGPGEWRTLEPGMAVDEEIDLSQYRIDYNEQQYRLITYVNDDMLCAEFTFEETFIEMMQEKKAAEEAALQNRREE